ncbi:cytochrome P450 [Streptomyces sp. NPDC000410]|uniref:cytochrome P450 n=1 Tax=Streptomyces sp. NPDC000410 TaxID=3154254 RepID=UPI00331E1695
MPAPFDPAKLPDLADPYPDYRRYRDAGPVHPGAEPATWYVFAHAEVGRVLTGRGFGRVRPGGGPSGPVPADRPVLRRIVENWLVFLDPPRHTRLRALVAPAVTGHAVTALRPRIRQIADDLVARLAERKTVDLVTDFAAPFPLLVISELLGVDRAHHAWFRARALDLQEAGSARAGRTPDGHARAERAARELSRYFEEEAAVRRAGDRGDLISALVRAADDDGALTGHELAATCVHLLTAGHETTTSLLAKAVLSLHAHPGVREELSARHALLPAAVDEFVRHDAPVQMVTRWVYEDTELGGHGIRAGDKLVLVLGAANRDPARFDRPDVLDIHRDTVRQHCGFGMGIHYCVGASLARAEAEIGLAVLLEGLPALRAGARPVVAAEYAPDWVFHGPSRLMLCL